MATPTVARLDVVDEPAADFYPARGRLLQPRDHPEQCGLAATGRADEDHELAVLDVEIHALDHLSTAPKFLRTS